MTIHTILYTPDPKLRAPCEPITVFDGVLQTLVDDMFETMYAARGVGLAGPQIGINKRIAVIDATQDKSQQLVLINPDIIAKETPIKTEEGCLSVPGAWEKVTRYQKVTIKALDRSGKPYEMTGENLLAQAMQHEIDHLYGKLYFDMLSSLKRTRVKKQVERFKRHKKC